MLSESVLRIDRTGLPYFVVMVDDSASEQVVDQYADARAKSTALELAKVAGHPEPDRLALAQGLLEKDDGAILRELQKKHRVRLYLVSNTARPLAEIDKPTERPARRSRDSRRSRRAATNLDWGLESAKFSRSFEASRLRRSSS